MGFIESVTKILMPWIYITCLWSSVSITWRANELFVKKKILSGNVTYRLLCVVLRKRCTKATKKKHYSQLVILFSFTKQNKQKLYLTLTSSTHLACRRRLVRLFFDGSQKKSPTTATGAWTDTTTHMTSNKPIKIFCWFVQPTCSLSPTHLHLAPTSVCTHLKKLV